MILAEELDADRSRLGSRHGNNDPAYADPVSGMHITSASSAIRNSSTQYRELGARTRARPFDREIEFVLVACRWLMQHASANTY